MSERQIEMLWRCHCGKKNLGRHMKCEACGRPKEEDVEYEMPEDVETAATVTDEKLLRMATAGENWHCAYCNSDQRALDGSCGNCGAGRKEKATEEHARARAATARAPELVSERSRSVSPNVVLWVALVVCALMVGTCVYVVVDNQAPSARAAHELPTAVTVSAPAFVEEDMTVASVQWKRTIATDRWQLVDREGFDPPGDAIDKKKTGDRVHHQDQVLDHMETVYDNVDVPDGTRTESYTEHVTCGQDCTTSPRSCRQSCTSNKNGFATCRDICTGGDRSCTTKYCDETRTRQIPKTRTERRPRQEARYRSEPRYAPWYSYKEMDWVQIATIDSSGSDISPAWPDAGAPSAHDAGAKMQERRSESYSVSFKDDKGALYTYNPRSAEELTTFAPASHHRMRATMQGIGGPVVPVP